MTTVMIHRNPVRLALVQQNPFGGRVRNCPILCRHHQGLQFLLKTKNATYHQGQTSLLIPLLPETNYLDEYCLKIEEQNHEHGTLSVCFGSYHKLSSLKKTQRTQTNQKKTQTSWEQKFALLREFKRNFGHTNVPSQYVIHGVKLGGWVETQRQEYQKRRFGVYSPIMNDRRVGRLERLGFEWKSPQQEKTKVVNGVQAILLQVIGKSLLWSRISMV